MNSTAPIASYRGATSLADEQLVDRAAELARSSQAESTRKGYASDLRCFEAFCRARGLDRIPATPQTVALYVTHLAPTHRVATIRRRLAAIAVEHRRAGLDSPASHRIVREIMRGTTRRYGSAVRRVDAATDQGRLRRPLTAGRFRDVRGRGARVARQHHANVASIASGAAGLRAPSRCLRCSCAGRDRSLIGRGRNGAVCVVASYAMPDEPRFAHPPAPR